MRLLNFYNPSAKICSNGNPIKSGRNLKKLNVRQSQRLGIICPRLIEIGVNISENLGKEVVLPALSLITPLIIIYSQVSMYSKLSKELLNNVMRLT